MFNLRPWEAAVRLPFDPTSQDKRNVTWVNVHGQKCEGPQQGISAENAFIQAQNQNYPSLEELKFPNPNKFVSGRLHEKLSEWEYIFENSLASEEIRGWVYRGVDLFQYIIHFQGIFAGVQYDHDFPPPRCFHNSSKCIPFIDFINETILDYSALTVEPTKPRLCINLMYLNNWMRDAPFSLDTLKDVPRVTKQEAFYSLVDDRSGFDNVLLENDSRDLVCFQWGGYFFRFRSLPFGFKLSSYVYHSLNLQPVSYIRSKFSIPIFLYIDDRLIEEIRSVLHGDGQLRALLANYIVCEILVRLGYCINLGKSVFVPTQTPIFLGFTVDSVNRCFRLTSEKKAKFAELREACLCSSKIKVLDLQRLVGRCISFLLVVPGAKLFTREMNLAISEGLKSGCSVPLTLELKEELESWRFLDNWTGKLEWKRERHMSLELFSDSSLFKWGGIVHLPSGSVEISGFWVGEERELSIMSLEAKGLLNVLKSVKDDIKGHRVDAHVDNQVLLNSWKNQGARSRELNKVLKELFQFVLDLDVVLNLSYVGSKSNPADAPSRELQKSDAMLAPSAWELIQTQFGGDRGHTVDLMSLDSNCMKDKSGNSLKHFSPFPNPESAGVNVFAQIIGKNENCYVNPPFTMIGPVINFLKENQLTCTVIVPAADVTPVWLPAIKQFIEDAMIVGYKGQKHVVLYPSRRGFLPDKYGLWSNLWALRMTPTPNNESYARLLYTLSPRVGQNSHLVIGGDSMVRFMGDRRELSSPLVHIRSRGGALMSQVQAGLWEDIRRYPPKVIFVHAGINDLSKTHLFINEYQQISSTIEQLTHLERLLKTYTVMCPDVRITISAIVTTKDGYINARSDVLNAEIEQCCRRNNWTFMDNGNITVAMLRDTVHLNEQGENTFMSNVMHMLCEVLS